MIMKISTLRLPNVVCVALLALACGCGKGTDGRTLVSGEVKLDGQPLPSGTVSFMGDKGFAVAVGDIKGGKFSLSESGSRKGITPGNYAVCVSSWLEEPGKELPTGGFSEGKSAVPAKYRDPKLSGLNAEVKEGQSNQKFDFELSSK